MGVAGSKSGGANNAGGSSRRGGAGGRADGGASGKASGKAPDAGGEAGMPLKFVIPSNRMAGRDVQTRILDDVMRLGYHSQSVFAINLALEEALANAINHGNRLDPKKQVRVWARVEAKQCEIIVEDEGPGFDRGRVPDPTETENLEKCSGRGILLIEAYMNFAEWTHGGRRLRMIKHNEAEMMPGG
jgi:serine/threonine-protein kinase RsbW